MSEPAVDMQALAQAFQVFTQTTRTMEESFRRLEARVQELDRELAEKNRELAVTTDYLNSILDSMSDGVIAVDTEEVISTFNRAAADILGFKADEVRGRPFGEIFGRSFSVGRGRRFTELTARDGKKIPVSEKDSPMSDRAGSRIGTVKVFQDLTEIESLREQVRRKDRLAALGEMAATVAHEIRNPLGGIRGFAALLARDIEEDDPRSRLVRRILRGTQDLDNVVTQLLEYTRPLQPRIRPVPCAEVVASALNYIEADPDIVIRSEVPPDLRMMADPDLMRQVILNIVLNAVQSISGAGEVTISTEAGKDFMAVVVSDTGCGMTPDQLEKIFSPFFTTKEKGTGLGLALATKIVEGHGGSLDARSSPGAGSTFWIRIPRAE